MLLYLAAPHCVERENAVAQGAVENADRAVQKETRVVHRPAAQEPAHILQGNDDHQALLIGSEVILVHTYVLVVVQLPSDYKVR